MNEIVEIYTDISLNNFDKNTKSFGISHFIIDQFENEIKFRQNVKFADVKIIKDNERFDTSVLEAYAIYIALCNHEIKNLSNMNNDLTFNLYTDSESCLFAYYDVDFCHSNIKNHTIIGRIKNKIKNITDKGHKFEIFHIKAHSNVYGNEIANDLAIVSRKKKNKEVTFEQIQYRAYKIFEESGNENQDENWFAAVKYYEDRY